MEVHQHPHHLTHKKKWGEYVLEFLMLFLAVFLGFLAENIRESSVERQQEREYMRLMVTDLKKDTANINTMVTGRTRSECYCGSASLKQTPLCYTYFYIPTVTSL